ncbi:hypothetical protein ES703_49407 [subsurface metagenome]
MSQDDEKKKGILLTGLWENRNEKGEIFYSGPLSYGGTLKLMKNGKKAIGSKAPDLLLFVVSREWGDDGTPGAGDDGKIPF